MLKIGFMGDVMIGRLVDELLSSRKDTYIWGDLLETLHSTDFTIANLEAALTTSKKEVYKVFNFKAHPSRVNVLSKGKIDLVNIANNHVLDYDKEGLIETLEVLDKAHISHVGAGKNEKEAKAPVILEKNGIKVGVLGYTDNEPSWRAFQNKPGTAYIPINKDGVQEVLKDIKMLEVDLLIVSLHWGPNMKETPSHEFITFARTLIDNGVDIIHGHSAHIFQGVERYKNGLILYDTGDFVDDYAVDPLLRNDFSFFFIVEVKKEGFYRLRLIPTEIKECQVSRAKEKNAKISLERMRLLSLQFQTHFSLENGELILQV